MIARCLPLSEQTAAAENSEPLEDIMYWDCFSPYVDVQRRQRLAGLQAQLIRPDGKKALGDYMFTLDWSREIGRASCRERV